MTKLATRVIHAGRAQSTLTVWNNLFEEIRP